MAINPDYPMLSFAQANPFLTGMQFGQQGMQQALSFPKELLAKELENKKANLMNQIYGVQAKYAEPMTQQDLRKAQLMNAYQQQVNQFYGPNIQSEIGLRGAQTNKINTMLPQELLAQKLANRESQTVLDNPLLRSPDTKTLGALQMSGAISPEQKEEMIKGIVQQPLTDVQYKQGVTESMKANRAGKAFTSMPMPVKSASIALLRGAGYTDTEATRALLANQDIGDLLEAKQHKRDGSDVVPIYAPTSAIQTQQQRANIAQSGIQAIEPQITSALAPYAKKWNGVSLTQLRDSLAGGSDEKIGKAIGAAAASQELAMLRARSGGAPIGITLLRESLDASKTRLHVPDLSLTPKQFEIAQQTINDLVARLNKAENKALYPGAGDRNQSQSNISDEDIEFTAKKYGMSPDQVRDKLRQAGKL